VKMRALYRFAALPISVSGFFANGLKSVCENSILEGHGFSRAENDTATPGFSR